MTSNGRDSCSPLAVGAAAGEAAISRGIFWVDVDFLFSGIWCSMMMDDGGYLATDSNDG